MDNLILAEQIAQRGKAKQNGVIKHSRNREANLLAIHEVLKNKTYKTSEYSTFPIYEPKERLVYSLPFSDRIVHHAIMNVLKPLMVPMFTADTYCCIEGRGLHSAATKLKGILRNEHSAKYCLQIDIRKFYPSVDHGILKALLRRKFKDEDLLQLLDEIIDSAPGLPIGNYLSQYFANFYLTGFDHWLKETKGVKYYFRYADDIVIPSSSKSDLHSLRNDIQTYLSEKLKLTVKHNYKIFPVNKQGIDYLGYKFFGTHTLLRKELKKNMCRAFKRKNRNTATIASYLGWAKHCDSKHLLKKLHNN